MRTCLNCQHLRFRRNNLPGLDGDGSCGGPENYTGVTIRCARPTVSLAGTKGMDRARKMILRGVNRPHRWCATDFSTARELAERIEKACDEYDEFDESELE